MDPIFDRKGHVVGWLLHGAILNQRPTYRAFLLDGRVYSYGARYLGEFSGGFFRDQAGRAVAFLRGATSGPLTPITQIPPVPPIPPIRPITPIPPIPPIAPIPLLNWSDLTWEQFLSAGHPRNARQGTVV